MCTYICTYIDKVYCCIDTDNNDTINRKKTLHHEFLASSFLCTFVYVNISFYLQFPDNQLVLPKLHTAIQLLLRIFLYTTVHYCTLLYISVYYCALLYTTVYFCTLLYITVYYCVLLYTTVYYCILLMLLHCKNSLV